jgi:DNA modification methylase
MIDFFDELGRKTIPLTDIRVSERMERDLGDVQDFANSIAEFGLFNAIILDDENILVAGMRRLTAFTLLSVTKDKSNPFDHLNGWDRIPFIRLTEWDEYEKLCAELVENLHRKDLSWSERDIQIAELHKKRTEKYGEASIGILGEKKVRGWRLADTAKVINKSFTDVALAVKVAKAMESDPTLAAESSRAMALKKIKQREIQEIRRILAERAGVEVSSNIALADCREWLKTIPSESISMILTDAPFGIDMDTFMDGTIMIDEFTRFKDSYNESLQLIKDIRDDLYRILLPNSHLYMFCGSLQINDILFYYGEKFSVRSVALIWDKMTPGYTANKGKSFSNRYEQILFMWKGSREFNEGEGIIKPHEGDILPFRKLQGKDKVGVNEKPVELLKQLILLSTNEGDIIVDPFCGSGSTMEAAASLERKCLTCDNNPEMVTITKARMFTFFEDQKGEAVEKEKKAALTREEEEALLDQEDDEEWEEFPDSEEEEEKE